jgi:hypothetical protein
MRAHRTLSLWHVAWLAMAVCALVQRPSVVDDSSDEQSSLTRSQLVPRVALAVTGTQLKRTTWAAGDGTLVLPASVVVAELAWSSVQTQRLERSEATTPASRARLTAHPPCGPPAG